MQASHAPPTAAESRDEADDGDETTEHGMRSQVQAGDAREGGQRHGAQGEHADGEPEAEEPMGHAHAPEPRVPGDAGAHEERGPDMGPAQVFRAEERGRPGDEPREDGTDHEVHGEAERDLVDIREGPDTGKARDEGPPEEREAASASGALTARSAIVTGTSSTASPTGPLLLRRSHPRAGQRNARAADRGGNGGSGDGPLVVGARLEHTQGGDVRPEVQGAVAHEQAQHRKVDDEHQRREPAEPLRPRVDPGAGPLTTRGHWRDLRSERRRAW